MTKVANIESESYISGYEEGFISGNFDAKNGKPDRTATFPMSDDFEIGFKEGYEEAYTLMSHEMVLTE